MRERRLREGQRVLFDYRDLVDRKSHKGEVLIKMKKGPMSYVTLSGTRFWKDHPFQWVGKDESDHLLSLPESGYVYFVKATIEDVEDYYAY